MISENLSHDCLIHEKDYEKYKDVEYKDKLKNKKLSATNTIDVVKVRAIRQPSTSAGRRRSTDDLDYTHRTKGDRQPSTSAGPPC